MGKLLVCEKRCNECLFSKNNVVRSQERVDDIVTSCDSQNSYFVCHKGSIHAVGEPEENVCCKGYFDRRSSALVRLAIATDNVKFVPIPQKDDTKRTV
jgi:hypothetical protein